MPAGTRCRTACKPGPGGTAAAGSSRNGAVARYGGRGPRCRPRHRQRVRQEHPEPPDRHRPQREPSVICPTAPGRPRPVLAIGEEHRVPGQTGDHTCPHGFPAGDLTGGQQLSCPRLAGKVRVIMASDLANPRLAGKGTEPRRSVARGHRYEAAGHWWDGERAAGPSPLVLTPGYPARSCRLGPDTSWHEPLPGLVEMTVPHSLWAGDGPASSLTQTWLGLVMV